MPKTGTSTFWLDICFRLIFSKHLHRFCRLDVFSGYSTMRQKGSIFHLGPAWVRLTPFATLPTSRFKVLLGWRSAMDSGRARRRDARRPIGAAGVVTPGHAMTPGVDERPGVVWFVGATTTCLRTIPMQHRPKKTVQVRIFWNILENFKCVPRTELVESWQIFFKDLVSSYAVPVLEGEVNGIYMNLHCKDGI